MMERNFYIYPNPLARLWILESGVELGKLTQICTSTSSLFILALTQMKAGRYIKMYRLKQVGRTHISIHHCEWTNDNSQHTTFPSAISAKITTFRSYLIHLVIEIVLTVINNNIYVCRKIRTDDFAQIAGYLTTPMITLLTVSQDLLPTTAT